MKKKLIAGIIAVVLAVAVVLTCGFGSMQNGKMFGKSDLRYWFKSEPQPVESVYIPVKGDKGDQGEQGLPGEKGDKGDQGEQGLPGEKGDKGDQGEQGSEGLTPSIGSNGNWFIGENDTGVPAQGSSTTQGTKCNLACKGQEEYILTNLELSEISIYKIASSLYCHVMEIKEESGSISFTIIANISKSFDSIDDLFPYLDATAPTTNEYALTASGSFYIENTLYIPNEIIFIYNLGEVKTIAICQVYRLENVQE